MPAITYREAAACYGDMPNPRWIYCHAELNKRPTLGEYLCWLSDRQTEFMQRQSGTWLKWNDMVTELGPSVQLRFNAYLEERLNHLRSETISGHSDTAV